MRGPCVKHNECLLGNHHLGPCLGNNGSRFPTNLNKPIQPNSTELRIIDAFLANSQQVMLCLRDLGKDDIDMAKARAKLVLRKMNEARELK